MASPRQATLHQCSKALHAFLLIIQVVRQQQDLHNRVRSSCITSTETGGHVVAPVSDKHTENNDLISGDLMLPLCRAKRLVPSVQESSDLTRTTIYRYIACRVPSTFRMG